ncbi:MAG: tRNA (adenosine(37)-N6)-threonylcarbamoyltransferase complex dimerization subunit type 1 TsaB [Xanthomonadales bacterium]|nr:tRNA (adenosine(37)-N6)-threonylcarbamoyltransferase complex dimerization subunit type 1 TsaB [Xanthomonadales bacterium]
MVEPRLLAIETSSEACSVALRIGGDTLEHFELAPLMHAERLLPAVRALLAEAGIGLSGLDAIAFGRGPGSFTSLRIGIGVVQGLAWGAGLPVVPVSSLAALAQAAAEQAPPPAERIRVAVDARMQEVFSGDFTLLADMLVRALGEERVCPPAALERPRAPFVAVGNGFARFEELAAQGQAALACFADLWPRAATVALLAAAWLRESEPLPPALAQPVYIRNQVAIKTPRA